MKGSAKAKMLVKYELPTSLLTWLLSWTLLPKSKERNSSNAFNLPIENLTSNLTF